MHLPPEFKDQMSQLLGPEFPDFLQAMDSPPPVSVRRHFLKSEIWSEIYEGVKWCVDGVYLPNRPVFTLDPLFHAGAYYVQEASSMLISHALRQINPDTPAPNVLDLCGAPGGKSTLLASELPPDRFLVCNEAIVARHPVLKYNLAKWGMAGVHSSQADSRDYAALADYFDLVLVDAPCSGEGLFRKDRRAMEEWSPAQVHFCASRQRRILGQAAGLVKPGGYFIYSTCTYNSTENQDNARWLATELGFDFIPLETPAEWGVTSGDWGLQCFPHKVRGEGFFLACFRRKPAQRRQRAGNPKSWKNWTRAPKAVKTDLINWISPSGEMDFIQSPDGEIRAILSREAEQTMELEGRIKRFLPGQAIGVFKGKDFIPAPELALNTAISVNLPVVALSKEQALRFLKKEPFECVSCPGGWFGVQYNGLTLGWAKGLKDRVNNYYPKEWRILMELPER